MMNENNEILHAEEEEDGDEQPDGKQAAETQQPSPQPNMERRATKKNRKAIKHSVSIASVMEEIHREADTKKISFFSVISLSRNYEEDPHWFNIVI